MKLNRVTITGADDAVRVAELCYLTEDFPFVEWGILASQSRSGSARYPDLAWRQELASKLSHGRLSLHLCGGWVKTISADAYDWGVSSPFGRLQVNHGGRHDLLSHKFWRSVMDSGQGQQIILQQSHESWPAVDRKFVYLHEQDAAKHRFVPLFDRSGGRGELPGQWPRSLPGVYCGYAGGLRPENLDAQLDQIVEANGDQPFWIDVESGVRTDDKFDLKKVAQLLRMVAKRASLDSFERVA